MSKGEMRVIILRSSFWCVKTIIWVHFVILQLDCRLALTLYFSVLIITLCLDCNLHSTYHLPFRLSLGFRLSFIALHWGYYFAFKLRLCVYTYYHLSFRSSFCLKWSFKEPCHEMDIVLKWHCVTYMCEEEALMFPTFFSFTICCPFKKFFRNLLTLFRKIDQYFLQCG
jgi:hypothetical protein